MQFQEQSYRSGETHVSSDAGKRGRLFMFGSSFLHGHVAAPYFIKHG
jgi:hypothetical protein